MISNYKKLFCLLGILGALETTLKPTQYVYSSGGSNSFGASSGTSSDEEWQKLARKYAHLGVQGYSRSTPRKRNVKKIRKQPRTGQSRLAQTQRQKHHPSTFVMTEEIEQATPDFSWPIPRHQFWISSFYGWRARGRLHAGLDLASPKGTPVRAAADGIVAEARNAGSFGNMVLIAHNRVFKSRYAHLLRIRTRAGAFVKKGDLIGYVGNTGRVSGRNGHHLHFEVLVHNKTINPMRVM